MSRPDHIDPEHWELMQDGAYRSGDIIHGPVTEPVPSQRPAEPEGGTPVDHGIVYGDPEDCPLPPFDPDTEREAKPPRCTVRTFMLPAPHDRCMSPDWPNHHHVFGA